MSIAANRVVVGYDASPESKEAVRWAAIVAERRSSAILVVSATGADDTGASAKNPEYGIIGEHMAYTTAEEGAELARQTANVKADAIGVHQDPATVLTEYSEDAQLVIVGHRGSGQLRAGFLGSVAFAVTTHAKCPVAVVRESQSGLPTAERPSVIGFDGSKHSIAALHQAAQWASETNSLLRIVVAWAGRTGQVRNYGTRTGEEPAEQDSEASSTIRDYGQSSAAHREDEVQLRAEQIAQDAVDEVHKVHPGLKVEKVVAAGRPSDVIVTASADASVVIVGARGRGNFASLLLGSVSREVIEQAKSAVYVVR